MINKIKNKYYSYQPGEFLPVRIDGKVANMRDFHLYKAKCFYRALTSVNS